MTKRIASNVHPAPAAVAAVLLLVAPGRADAQCCWDRYGDEDVSIDRGDGLLPRISLFNRVEPTPCGKRYLVEWRLVDGAGPLTSAPISSATKCEGAEERFVAQGQGTTCAKLGIDSFVPAGLDTCIPAAEAGDWLHVRAFECQFISPTLPCTPKPDPISVQFAPLVDEAEPIEQSVSLICNEGLLGPQPWLHIWNRTTSARSFLVSWRVTAESLSPDVECRNVQELTVGAGAPGCPSNLDTRLANPGQCPTMELGDHVWVEVYECQGDVSMGQPCNPRPDVISIQTCVSHVEFPLFYEVQ